MNDILFEPVQLGDLQLGYCRTPGIYNAAQAAAWRRITDAVHDEGGLIVAQLMHVGRVASALNKPVDSATVAPSAITARGEIYTDQQGMQPLDAPRALSLTEIAAVLDVSVPRVHQLKSSALAKLKLAIVESENA